MTKPSNVIYTFFKDCLITNKLDTSYIVIAEESWLQGWGFVKPRIEYFD